jgi:hypothetical protein
MHKNSYYDITFELCELSEEIISQIRGQLAYFRISAYKDEASNQITSKIKDLKLIAKLLCSANLKDLFEDYTAETQQEKYNSVLIGCPLTMRVARLLKNFEQELILIKQDTFEKTPRTYDLKKSVRKFRDDLLAICPTGSRTWDFFQSI